MMTRDAVKSKVQEVILTVDQERHWRGFGLAMGLADLLSDNTDITLGEFVELVDSLGWALDSAGQIQGP